MTNEEKQLLFKDLCTRLPYGVILQLNLWEGETINSRLTGIDEDGNLTADVPADCAFSIENVKPYLRPMSSMTATESIEYQKRVKVIQDVERTLHWCDTPESIDWLDEHHFDYRGMIGKGLALEAPNGMYNNQ